MSLLLANDAEERFCPKNFFFENEDKRAGVLAKALEEMLGVSSLVEDYSVNQDGPLFLRIILHDKKTLLPKSTVYISKFGRLLTMDGVSGELPDDLIRRLEDLGYKYIELSYLDESYEGGNSSFRGHSWYYRYFSPWLLSS